MGSGIGRRGMVRLYLLDGCEVARRGKHGDVWARVCDRVDLQSRGVELVLRRTSISAPIPAQTRAGSMVLSTGVRGIAPAGCYTRIESTCTRAQQTGGAYATEYTRNRPVRTRLCPTPARKAGPPGRAISQEAPLLEGA